MRILSVAAAITFGSMTPASAQLLGVGDIVFDPTNYVEAIAVAKAGAAQVQNLELIYGNATKQLQTLENVYSMFAHVTNVQQFAQVLMTLQSNVPMLADAAALEAAFRGHGLTTGLAGQILAQLTKTQFYKPAETNFQTYQLNRRAEGTAAYAVAGQAAYAAAVEKSKAMQELRAQVGTNDPKAALDLAARASIEAAAAQYTTQQLQAAAMQRAAARDAQTEQYEQIQRAGIAAALRASIAAGKAAAAGQVDLATADPNPETITIPQQ